MSFKTLLATGSIVSGQLFNLESVEQQRPLSKQEVVIQQVVTRASLDIGSGETKVTIGDVNPVDNKITKIWHQSFKAVELRKDLGASKDGSLSQDIEKELIKTLKEMQWEVNTYCPSEWVGVATSVFRTAKNGKEFLGRVEEATGVKIHIIPQTEEGAIGFASAVAASGENPENILAWDSGSGSFQISSLIDGKVEIYGAEFAMVPAMESLYAIRQQIFSKDTSPNPVSKDEALELIEIIRKKLPELPSWLVKNQKKVITIGGISIFSFGMQATGSSSIIKNEVLEAILQNCGKSDEQLSHFPNYKEAVAALVLLYTVMDHCGFDQVSYCRTNGSCEGLLISPKYWIRG